MRIVLDTNVVVSGMLRPGGAPAEILAGVVSGQLRVCFDERVIGEYREVLLRPRFALDADAVDAVIDQMQADGVPVMCQGIPQGLPDPDDDVFIEVALAARAVFLVTGNLRHFPLGLRRGVAVVTPRQFLDNAAQP